jgi:hypothetical protein
LQVSAIQGVTHRNPCKKKAFDYIAIDSPEQAEKLKSAFYKVVNIIEIMPGYYAPLMSSPGAYTFFCSPPIV